MDRLLRLSPPSWVLYPVLLGFLIQGTWQGMWQSALESALVNNAHTAGEIAAIIEYVPSDKQLKAIGDIRI